MKLFDLIFLLHLFPKDQQRQEETTSASEAFHSLNKSWPLFDLRLSYTIWVLDFLHPPFLPLRLIYRSTHVLSPPFFGSPTSKVTLSEIFRASDGPFRLQINGLKYQRTRDESSEERLKAGRKKMRPKRLLETMDVRATAWALSGWCTVTYSIFICHCIKIKGPQCVVSHIS